MKTIPVAWILVSLLLNIFPTSLRPLSGQEARYLSLGLSAGPGAVQLKGGRAEKWDFGPVLGGRLEWSSIRSVAFLALDVQPFQAEGTSEAGDFRAAYVLPSYAVISGGRRIGFGLGMGIFDFKGGAAEDGIEVGFVAGASGSVRIRGSYFVELGWKGIQNVKALRANIWSLQLVKGWRL